MAGPNQVGQASVGVDIDNSDLARGLRESEAQVRESMSRVDKMRARPEIDADMSDLDKDIVQAKKYLDDLDRRRAEAKILGDDSDFQAARQRVLLAIRDLQRRKAEITIESRDLRNAERDLKSATKAQQGFTKSVNDNEAQLRSNNVELARMRERYLKLAQEYKKVSKFPVDRREAVTLERINADLGATRDRIRELGGNYDDLDHSVTRDSHTLRNWANSLTHVRLQLGFFSATLRQMAIGVVTLGPIIEGLIGGLVALAGSLGAGILGAAAVGGAAMTGFGLATLGIVTALHPAFAELSKARAATQAYSDAVLKYGKNSDQAKTAQQNMNSTLKGVDPAVRNAAKSLSAVSTKWTQLTEPTRARFFELMGDSLHQLMPVLGNFANQTNRTFDVAADGADKWVKTLVGPEVQGAMNNIMSNFRASLPTWMSGINSLMIAFANVFSEGSNHLQEFADGFKEWADSVRDFTREDSFGKTVDGWVKSTHAWFDLFGSMGHLLTTVLGGGKKAGDDLVTTLTHTLDRWNAFLQTGEGQKGMQDWFRDTANMTKQFVSALAPLVPILANVAETLAPFVTGILSVTQTLASAIGGIDPGIIRAIGVAFGTWKILGVITGLVRGFATAVAFLGAAGGLSGILGLAGGAGAGGGAAAAGAEFALFGEGAAAAAGGLSLFTAAAIALPVVALAGGAIAISNINTETQDAKEVLEGFNAEVKKGHGPVKQSAKDVNDLTAAYEKVANVPRATGPTRIAGRTAPGTPEWAQGIQKQVKFVKGSYQDLSRAAVNMSQKEVGAWQSAALALRENHDISQQEYQRFSRIITQTDQRTTNAIQHFNSLSPKAKKLTVSTNSTKAQAELARVGNAAARLGGKQAVIRILGNSDNAQQAVRRLQDRLQGLKDKKVTTTLQDNATDRANKIRSNLEHVTNQKYQARIDGDPSGAQNAAKQADSSLTSVSHKSYNAHINASWMGQAAVSAAQSAMASLHDKTVTITTINAALHRAQGGPVPRSPAGGGKVAGPTLFQAGEERTPEYVIATNPAYRRSNVNYLSQAADEFGYQLIETFAQGGRPGLLPGLNYQGLTGTQSKYAAFHNQIQLSEQSYSNLQRHYQEQLALGVRYPTPSLSTVADQKRHTIDLVDGLVNLMRGHIIPRMNRNIRQTGRGDFLHTPHKPSRQHGESSKEYGKRLDQWHKEVKRAKKDASRRARDKKEGLRDQIFDLKNELATLGQDRYAYNLDLQSLLSGGDAPGGAGGQATLEEQFATFNQARYDALKQFGGNFSPLGAAFASAGSSFASAGAAPEALAAGGGGVVSGASLAAPSGGKTVNQYINMPAPQDAHLFTQALEWEAQGV